MESRFFEFCKNWIKEHLEMYEGNVCDGCDLGYDITSAMNMDGTLTFSRYKAMEYLTSWWEDASEYFNFEKENYGEGLHNPFENPERYMVCMVVEGVNRILAECPTVYEKWNDNFTLDGKMISTILAEVEEITEINF